MLEKNPEIEDLLRQEEFYKTALREVEQRRYAIIRKMPKIYGTCKKQLTCLHYSHDFSIYDETVIEVGDVIEFGRYPQLYGQTRFSPCCREFFDVPLDDEYFDFFESHEFVKCRQFDD
jgi:hypothetical protein